MQSRLSTVAAPAAAADPFNATLPRPTSAPADGEVLGSGKCTAYGCSCPSYVDPPGGFDCNRCGHAKSEHW